MRLDAAAVLHAVRLQRGQQRRILERKNRKRELRLRFASLLFALDIAAQLVPPLHNVIEMPGRFRCRHLQRRSARVSSLGAVRRPQHAVDPILGQDGAGDAVVVDILAKLAVRNFRGIDA